MADNVNHPSHYEASTSIECIEAMVAMFGDYTVRSFCLCNAYKYIWRHKNKNGLEDLQKAQWYLDKAKELGEEMVPWEDVGMKMLFPEYVPPLVTLQKLLDEKTKQWQESDHS